ncbi:glycoside hydrolase family 15 protein [Gymnopus androsaceus JB14]|uniref:Glycoside hydrolase family 15 protein n=1 Tax=Gymnopus androsaceus JB14 TaxID=1447944 RepID=A0A6A4IBB9_9AGAR|nr:glycoside hydrolase family 15 protein [Gymnopus androsaceus JB14]
MQTPSAFDRDYIAIADHGLQYLFRIGNLHTGAMVSTDGSIESYCIPDFDSPSVFARILDKDKGGHFSITPTVPFSTKQNYLPSSNVLQTKFLNEKGVVSVTDFLPRQAHGMSTSNKPLLHWLVRRVEVIRGSMPILMQCAPAFNYARSSHQTSIQEDTSCLSQQQKAVFVSDALTLDLRFIADSLLDNVHQPEVSLKLLDLSRKGHLGPAVSAEMNLSEGQVITFVLRSPPSATQTEQVVDPAVVVKNTVKLRPADDPHLTKSTTKYWNDWIRNSTYSGSWKEAVHRSALALKLLIYEPTGAVVASPTFSLPEYIGGTRNWDYRASWIRDSSFTLYALLRLGFTHEATAYMEFIFERLRHKNPDGSIQIMYTIHGGKDLEEIELTHFGCIGNGAADHLQLDIYGELMDCIYLGQKFGKPLSYDDWRKDVVANWRQPDLSIWEVRNKKRQFTIMLWVAVDRGLRIADKRSLPCPKRSEWLATRDEIYEEIMTKAWNKEHQVFGQSYEESHVLDSAVLIMPLVFFMQGSDPRFVSTLKQILKTPDRGGLTSNASLNLVFRYDVHKSDDGVGGEEGTFGLCTLWCVEALARAGAYDRPMLRKAVAMFEDFLLYLNHVGLCTEEISDAGEGLGNAVQGFTHVTLISAAYNLSRTLGVN